MNMEENQDEIKLTFIEIDENCTPIKDENGENKVLDDINNVDYAAMVIPEGYMALVLYNTNFNKYYYKYPKEEQEKNKYKDLLVGNSILRLGRDYFYWCVYHLLKKSGAVMLFKEPDDIKIKKEGTYLTAGGFRANYIYSPNLVTIKYKDCNNTILNEVDDEEYNKIFSDRFKEVFSKIDSLPKYCYPLYNCTDDISFIDVYENVGKKQVKKMLNYIAFEYPNTTKYKISNYNKNHEETAWVNGMCFYGLDFINKTFLNECFTESDYWKLLNNITEFGGTSLDLVSFEDIKEESIEYLWYPYIPLGSIVLLAGDPGIGKSYLALAFASIISKGESFPFDVNYKSIPSHPSNIILQNAEDGKGTTIKSRLNKLGADMTKIWFINESSSQFKLNNLDILEKALYEKKPKLVVIDPITQYLPKISMDRANEVRNTLAPIAELASRYKCTFLLIAHKNKNTKTDGIYRVLGSVDFVGICRSMLTASIVDGVTYLKQEKNSTAEFGKPIEYRIDENGLEFVRQVDNKEIDISVDKAIEEAKKFILKELENGEIPSKDIYSNAYSEGIAKATLDRAKRDLGVGSRKRKDENGTEYWVWVSNQSKDNKEAANENN